MKRAAGVKFFRQHGYSAIVCGSLIAKLWLTSDLATVPLLAGHDMSNFLEHAKSISLGRWFGSYDSLTLIKGPTFPIFLALTREFGISFPLAHLVLYLVSCCVALEALKPLVSDTRLRAVGFVVLFFNPDTFDSLSTLTDRALLSGSLTLLVSFCAVGLLLRQHRPVRSLWTWSVGLGCSLAAFWLNREEGIWIVAGLAIVLFPMLVRSARDVRRRSFERGLILATPIVILTLAIGAVRTVNGIEYGWPTVVELQSKDFIAAYTSLERIVHPPSDPRFPVPNSAMQIAYAVSPAAAELRPEFDGPRGDGWRTASCINFQACGDISGGWFMWTLRQGAELAGHYRTGSDARAYFNRLSAEIDRACDSGRIACAPKRTSLAPPIGMGDLPTLVWNFRAGLLSTLTWQTFSELPIFASTTPASVARDYLLVTNSQSVQDGRDRYDGWLVAPAAAEIEVVRDGQTVDDSSMSFSPSPDVATALGHHRGTAFARFALVTACSAECSLRITDERGSKIEIPLSPTVTNFANAYVTYHLDDAIPGADDETATFELKRRVEYAIAFVYERCTLWLVLAALGAFALALTPPYRFVHREGFVICSAFLASIAALLAILSVVQTFSFPGFTSQYLEPLHPLVIAWILVVAATVCRIGRPSGRQLSIGVGTLVVSAMILLQPGAGTPKTLPAIVASKAVASRVVAPFTGGCRSENVHAPPALIGSIDVVRVERGHIDVAGWAMDTLKDRPATAVCATVDRKFVAVEHSTYGISRPDVAKALAVADLAATGFAIEIPTASLAPGRHRIEILARSGDGTWAKLARPYDVDL